MAKSKHAVSSSSSPKDAAANNSVPSSTITPTTKKTDDSKTTSDNTTTPPKSKSCKHSFILWTFFILPITIGLVSIYLFTFHHDELKLELSKLMPTLFKKPVRTVAVQYPTVNTRSKFPAIISSTPSYVKYLELLQKNTLTQRKKVHVGVFDEHHFSLFFWVRAHKLGLIPRLNYSNVVADQQQNVYNLNFQGLPLLHIDSHSDAQIPQHYYNFKPFRDLIQNTPLGAKEDYVTAKNVTKKRHPFNDKKMTELLAVTSIGDFIPVAQYLELVGPRVVWLQSNFEGGGYNFNTGRYNAELGVRANAMKLPPQTLQDLTKAANSLNVESTFLCYRNPDGYSWNIHHRNGKKILTKPIHTLAQIAKEGVCVETEAFHNASHESFPIQWDVYNTDELFQSGNVIEDKAKFFNSTPYLLDIDLDYFSTDDEMLFNIVPRKTYGGLFKVLEEMVQEETILCLDRRIYEPTKNMSLSMDQVKKFNRNKISNLLHEMFFRGLMFDENSIFSKQPVQKSKLIGDSVFGPEILELFCKGSHHALEHLYQLSKLVIIFLENMNYFYLSLLDVNYGFPSVKPYCKVNQMFGVCPSGLPSKYLTRDEIMDQMNKLEKLIVAQEQLPAYVTISRSLDAYLPKVLHHFIESETLHMLERAFKQISPNVTVDVSYFDEFEPTSKKYEKEASRQFYDMIEKEASIIRQAVQEIDDPISTYLPHVNYKIYNVALMLQFLQEREVSFDMFVQDITLLKEFLEWKLTNAGSMDFDNLGIVSKPKNSIFMPYTIPSKRPRLCMLILKNALEDSNSTYPTSGETKEQDATSSTLNCFIQQLNQTFERELILELEMVESSSRQEFSQKFEELVEYYQKLFPTHFKNVSISRDDTKPYALVVDPSCVTFDMEEELKPKKTKSKKYINLEENPTVKRSGREPISISYDFSGVVSTFNNLVLDLLKESTPSASLKDYLNKMAYIDAQKEAFNKKKLKQRYENVKGIVETSIKKCSNGKL
ncbi:hypothetical protein C9374_009442 [Naegleria lovaniensis]|uniref:Uncharacterized protein n=1 Tax=Naegleria lovaniensis TaxID=51637 RepID=A0AA88H0Z8_NAELO|nr:uncharacterized protein C9374_009442 [Naegleria lovaniensis]KAG2392865.1 hypothetical protein C9374_009442 [Naegleria lovaniensis]